jgi:hypothetical protein
LTVRRVFLAPKRLNSPVEHDSSRTGVAPKVATRLGVPPSGLGLFGRRRRCEQDGFPTSPDQDRLSDPDFAAENVDRLARVVHDFLRGYAMLRWVIGLEKSAVIGI